MGDAVEKIKRKLKARPPRTNREDELAEDITIVIEMLEICQIEKEQLREIKKQARITVGKHRDTWKGMHTEPVEFNELR